MKRLALLPLSLLALSASAADYFPPSDAQGGWRTLKDKAEARALAGVDMDKLEQAYRAVERSNTENGGLVVISKGYLVLEKYFGKAHRNANPDMASTGKAFTSIACGVMLQEFKSKMPEGLDTKVFTQEFLPEAFPLRDPREADIRLGHLLCMTSGHNGEGPTPSGVIRGTAQPLKQSKGQDIRDVDGSSLRAPLWTAPGEGYSYSSPAPHIASMVLRRVTGKELPAYIEEKFAQPMGWGPWGYCLYRGDVTMAHANGAGSIAPMPPASATASPKADAGKTSSSSRPTTSSSASRRCPTTLTSLSACSSNTTRQARSSAHPAMPSIRREPAASASTSCRPSTW